MRHAISSRRGGALTDLLVVLLLVFVALLLAGQQFGWRLDTVMESVGW